MRDLSQFAWRRVATGVVAGVAAVAVVTAAIAVLKHWVNPLGLTSLYLLAIVPVAIVWGFLAAGIVAVSSYVAFAFFLSPPLHNLAIDDPDTAVGLVVSLVAAYVVSELARRAHDREREARLRAREAEEAQKELGRLADEQAALRRVATLVAEGAPNAEVFEAVTREVGLQCGADVARMERFDADRTVTAVAAWSRDDTAGLAVGTRFALEGESIAARVLESGGPARVDTFAGASGPIAREAQSLGIRSSVGCPIVVGGRVWGAIAASTKRPEPFPPDTESQIADFTELVATAVANAEARSELIASRARVLAAGDEARRRVVRDLHDGAQQRLVAATMILRTARHALEQGDQDAAALLAEALDEVQQGNDELRELAHGILPAALTESGLAAAVKMLVSRLQVPVDVELPEERLPAEIEASTYFVIAEALTNVAKHSRAARVDVTVSLGDGALLVDVRDDGVGGAQPGGSGLLGLRDRIASLGGELRIESPPGRGTRIVATLPLPGPVASGALRTQGGSG